MTSLVPFYMIGLTRVGGRCSGARRGQRVLEGQGHDGAEAHTEVAADAERVVAPELERVHVEGARGADRNAAGALHAGGAVDLDVVAARARVRHLALPPSPSLTTACGSP